VHPSHHLRVPVYEVEGETHEKFAKLWVSGRSYFWVPASAGAPGAFEALTGFKTEGHWRYNEDSNLPSDEADEDSNLPWPIPDPDWDGRDTFLA
jgi:hypothetical protein